MARRTLFRTLCAIVIGVLAITATAHSPLDSTRPADGATLAAAPTDIALTFRRNIRLTKVTWQRADGASGVLDTSQIGGFATDLVLPFGETATGEYLIEWRGLSDDGHPQKGTFTFRVK